MTINILPNPVNKPMVLFYVLSVQPFKEKNGKRHQITQDISHKQYAWVLPI